MDEPGHAPAEMTMGEWVTRLRTHAKMSQAKFAVEIGVSPPTVARWETGGMQPRGLARQALARFARRKAFPEPMPE